MTKCKKNIGLNVYSRKDGRYEVRVLDTRYTSDGKKKYKSFYGDTAEEALEKALKFQYESKNGSYRQRTKQTVAEWLAQWWKDYIKDLKAALTASSYEGLIKNHINPYIGGIRLQELALSDVQRLIRELQKYRDSKGKKLSAKTIRNAISTLSSALTAAVDEELIEKNPCEKAKLPNVEKHEIIPLNSEELSAFLEALEDDPEFKNAYLFCIYTGVREGECLGLSWSNVNFEKKTVTIAQQLQKIRSENGGTYVIKKCTKTKKPRTICVSNSVIACLKNEKMRKEENARLAGKLWNNEWDLVFTNDLGRHLIIVTFYKHFKRIVAKIGRPDARPHDLRHTFASLAIADNRGDIKSVQTILGHSNAMTTLNTYTHPDEDAQRESIGTVDAYIDTLKKSNEKQG